MTRDERVQLMAQVLLGLEDAKRDSAATAVRLQRLVGEWRLFADALGKDPVAAIRDLPTTLGKLDKDALRDAVADAARARELLAEIEAQHRTLLGAG
jgi:hypothetical protein